MPLSATKMRVGQFTIPGPLVHREPQHALLVLRGVLVVRAELQFLDNQIHYTGICEMFEECPLGDTPPYYDWELKTFDCAAIGPPCTDWRRRP